MTRILASDPASSPVRDSSRDAPRTPRGCPVCQHPLPSTRTRYCSAACRQRAYRERQHQRSDAHHAPAPSGPIATVAHTLYICPECDTRYLGQQRCPDCNRFCRRLGTGGPCPHCDEPVLVSELLGEEVLV